MGADLKAILERFGVLRNGHFLLTSGRHSDRYFEKFRILENPEVCETFARSIADRFRAEKVTVVCGPTTGGIIIAYEVARQLGARCVIAERGEAGRKIERGFRLVAGDRVLVVDDVMTTGGSLVETLNALRQYPAQVIGAAVYIDRSKGVDLTVPLHAAYRQEVVTYDASECPQCLAGVPLEEPGRGGKKP